MTFPSFIMWVRVRSPRQQFGSWFPLFVLWPFVALIALPLVLIGAIILWPKGWGRPLLLAGPLLLGLFFSLRGLTVKVEKSSEQIFISFV